MIIGSTTGRERPTTVSDAKKHGWVPSVTTVLRGGLPTPYGLELWRLRMLLEHALTTERDQNESDEEFVARIQRDYESAKSVAPDLGSDVHAGIAEYLLGRQYIPRKYESVPVIMAAERWIDANVDAVEAVERTIVNTDFGYAGTIDLVYLDADGDRYVVDWKTQEPKRGKVRTRDEWVYQLAAYEMAYRPRELPHSTAANVILPTDGGEPVVKQWTDSELSYGWQVFRSALRTFHLTNRWPGYASVS
jgi:hypothetical protein